MVLLLYGCSEKSVIFYANYLKCFLLPCKRNFFSAFPEKIEKIKCPENPLIFRFLKNAQLVRKFSCYKVHRKILKKKYFIKWTIGYNLASKKKFSDLWFSQFPLFSMNTRNRYRQKITRKKLYSWIQKKIHIAFFMFDFGKC